MDNSFNSNNRNNGNSAGEQGFNPDNQQTGGFSNQSEQGGYQAGPSPLFSSPPPGPQQPQPMQNQQPQFQQQAPQAQPNGQVPSLNQMSQGQVQPQSMVNPVQQAPSAQPNKIDGQASKAHKKSIKPRGPWMIIAIIFIVLSLVLGGAFGWALMQYIDYRDNANYKISQAVADEQKKVKAEMQKKFQEEAKLPNSLFVGPDDYGRVSFEYPKNWSVFVEKEGTAGTTQPFNAFFYPDVVPPVSESQQFAVRMTIEDIDYDKAVNRYASQVKKGDLKSSPVQVGLLNGTRLDGMFSKDIRGAAVLFKVRDKTLTLRTDSNAFMADFDKLIQTIQVSE